MSQSWIAPQSYVRCLDILNGYDSLIQDLI